MGECSIQVRKPYLTHYFREIPTRVVLYLLSLSCIIISFSLRTVINLTILAMVKEDNVNKDLKNNSQQLCFSRKNVSQPDIDYGGTLEWSADAQYYVLTIFFWTYIPSQIYGAIAASRYGSKIVIGVALLTSSACNLCIPLCSEIHYGVVIFLQLLNGFAQGVVWPAMYAMMGWWIPPQERARFITCFQGMTIGTALAKLISGYIIAYIGWKYVFYLTGSLGIIWCLVWYYLAFEKPELHPQISLTELNYIQKYREMQLHNSNQKVPWKSMLCSVPLWVIAIAGLGRIWINSTIVVYGPVYLKNVIGLEVQMNGLWSGLISFSTFFWALISSYISDKLLIHNVISKISIRKLFTGLGALVPGTLCLLISYLNCDANLILTVWAMIQLFLSSGFVGTMPNLVDIAPNFAGPTCSLFQVISMIPSIVSTYVANAFFKKESTIEAWNGIFHTSAGVIISSYVLYVIFGSAKIEKWNEVVTRQDDEKNENESLEILRDCRE